MYAGVTDCKCPTDFLVPDRLLGARHTRKTCQRQSMQEISMIKLPTVSANVTGAIVSFTNDSMDEIKNLLLRPKKVSGFWSLRVSRASAFLIFFFLL